MSKQDFQTQSVNLPGWNGTGRTEVFDKETGTYLGEIIRIIEKPIRYNIFSVNGCDTRSQYSFKLTKTMAVKKLRELHSSYN